MDLTGGTTAFSPAVDGVINGARPDLMFVNANSFTDIAVIKEYFEDLSVNPVIERFEAASLDSVALDGFVYFLPAPSEINCILYNKTLFEQYGWAVPTTFDELIALCNQITADTDGAVQPWNPNAKYDSVFSTAMEAIVYQELFGGKDNRTWYNDFCRGDATFAGHMEPLYGVMQALIDNGILREEHFNYSATTRGRDFQTGLLAMYNAPVSQISSAVYTFGYMPYPTTDGTLGYVEETVSARLCVPKKERTEAERKAVDRFIEFFGSAEGQQALIGDTLMVSNVKGVPFKDNGAMAGLEEALAQGHKFSRLDFPGSGQRTWTFRDGALAMVKGEKTVSEIIAEIDAHPYLTAEEMSTSAAVKLGDITERFTMLDFSFYIADMYRETAGADIGLINHGIAYRGNLVYLFPGEVYDSYMFPFRPRSFANDSTLVKVSMTGRQIMDALNHPVGNNCVSDSVYAFSGLQCEIAPWNELGTKYRSVKLASGAALEPDARYTVAIWDGTVAEEYVTEVLERCEGSWDELMAAKMRADGQIAPAKDGRVKLVWG